jgi:hypothetical protein
MQSWFSRRRVVEGELLCGQYTRQPDSISFVNSETLYSLEQRNQNKFFIHDTSILCLDMLKVLCSLKSRHCPKVKLKND